MAKRKFEASVANATNPELVALIQSMEGKQTPRISKIATARGNVVERTPPYRPEVQPVEFIWAGIKGWHATRYDAVGLRDYVQRFCDELSEDDMAKIVDHCDKVEEVMVEDEAVLFSGRRHRPRSRRLRWRGIGGRRRTDSARISIAVAMRRLGDDEGHSAAPNRMRTLPAKEINMGILAGPFFSTTCPFPRRFALVWGCRNHHAIHGRLWDPKNLLRSLTY